MFDDYRLTPNGLIFGILALLLLASAGWLYHAQLREPDMDRPSLSQTSNLLAILMPLGIAAVCYSLSDKAVAPVPNPDQKRMLYVNVVSSATSYALGVQMLGHDVRNWNSGFTAFVLVGLAAFISHVLGVTSYLTWLQLLCFGIAVLCASEPLFAGTPYSMYDLAARSEEDLELVNSAGLGSDLASNEHPPEAATAHKVVRLSPATRKVALWVVKVILLTLMHNFSPSPIDVTSSMEPRLDRNYKPVSQLDIVVSMFKESPFAIKETAERLKRLPEIGHRNPRLIVYTKDPSANVSQLLEQTGATSVIQLPNVGREGHTYLHHIVEQWEDLAAQTFFLQADIHNPREFFPRVRDYYTPQTGMLSLGFSGQTCNCRDCGDRFGWWDNTLVGEVWTQAMNETCTGQQMLMSYKGQFVASAARLRGNEQSLYKTMRTALEDPENLVHQEDYLQGRPDSMNAPFFGYTLERLWSVLLQCSEERIAARCPTLLSGTRRGGSKGDCQCFDVA
ncbi:hypothetical protein D6D04_04622 [Aureobasidium pullulans]|nr:hypothetical protein D6D04_04622 [Aureobasidium pullulans]